MEVQDTALKILNLSTIAGLKESQSFTDKIFSIEEYQYTLNRVIKIRQAIAQKCNPERCGNPCLTRITFLSIQYLENISNNQRFQSSENLDRQQLIDQKIKEFEIISNTMYQVDLVNHSLEKSQNMNLLSLTNENIKLEGNPTKELLGVVQSSRFIPFVDFGGKFPRRLTELQMQEGQLPESKEINLDKYEGLVIMVSGNDSGNWIYSAQIVEVGGAILSAIAKKVFS